MRERLAFLCRTADGFAVAQYDLEHRGPGDFFGKRQHGLPTLRVADAVSDAAMIETAATEAGALLADDPELSAPQHQPLQRALARLFDAAGGTAVN